MVGQLRVEGDGEEFLLTFIKDISLIYRQSPMGGTTPIWSLLEPSNKGHKFKLNLFIDGYYLAVVYLNIASTMTVII